MAINQIPLTPQERSAGWTHKINMLFSDLLTTVKTQIWPRAAGDMPAGTIVERVALRVVVLDNGSVSATLSIGDEATGTQYINAADVRGTVVGTTANFMSAASTQKLYTLATEDITATRTEGGTASTAGEFDVLLKILPSINQFAIPKK